MDIVWILTTTDFFENDYIYSLNKQCLEFVVPALIWTTADNAFVILVNCLKVNVLKLIYADFG